MAERNAYYQNYLPTVSENTGCGGIIKNDWTEFAEKNKVQVKIRPAGHRTGLNRHRTIIPLWKEKKRADLYIYGNPWDGFIRKALGKNRGW